MDRMIYLSMSGAKATMQRQELISNNLANVSTNGFRAELTALRSVPVVGDGASTRAFVLETTPGYNAEPGPISSTGRNLDVAMQVNAWLSVQGLDGIEAYTRAGSLDVNAEGQLVTRSGLTVLGDGGPITVPPNAQVLVGEDGTLSATVGNGRSQAIGRLKLVTPEAPLTRGTDGLFRSTDPLPADTTARLRGGVLEGSNANPIDAMVAMIAAARQFEQQMKMMQTAQEKEQVATKLLSNQG